VIVGNNEPMPAAIIFPSPQIEALDKEQQQVAIWEVMSAVNQSCPSHAQIKRDMIKILDGASSSKIQKSSKGTIMRGKFSTTFSDIIVQLYSNPKAEGNAVSLEVESLETRLKEITYIVQQQLGRDITTKSNFYDEGIDSTACMQIRNRILARLSPQASKKLSLNVAYETGNIQKLAESVGKLGIGSFSDTEENTSLIESEMLSMVTRFTKARYSRIVDLNLQLSFVHVNSLVQTGRVVLLTGSTGFLGAHILHKLLQTSDIEEIFLLVRPKAGNQVDLGSEAKERIYSTLASYKLSVPSSNSPKLTCIVADLTLPSLGLSVEQTSSLISRVSDVIHAAWAVNFSLPLSSFTNQFSSIVNLYNIASLATQRRHQTTSDKSTRVTFTFISSTASILSSEAPIQETSSTNPSNASPSGYGRSKWVAENILQNVQTLQEGKAFVDTPSVLILRVGQLTANTETGIWNMREAWPLMFDAGTRLLATKERSNSNQPEHEAEQIICYLPDLSHLPQEARLDWLPVNQAAKIVLELSFSGTHPLSTTPSSAPNDDKDPKVSPIPIYHILSQFKNGPTWRDIQQWLTGSLFTLPLPTDANPSLQAKYTFKFLPAEEWLSKLSAIPSETGAIKALIPLWQSAWTQVLPLSNSAGNTAEKNQESGYRFSTSRAESASPTMADLAKRGSGAGDGSASREEFLKMLAWIVLQGSR
jgi:thioester reductase-like protein